MKLNEGGNVVPNAVELRKENFPLVMANLKKVLPAGLNLYPIGSAGHKEISSDIDALIDANPPRAIAHRKKSQIIVYKEES